MLDPQPEFCPVAGVAEQLEPGLRRILAPNPSPMTYRGTNTYILGNSSLAVIDPGPDDDAHLAAILAACDRAELSHIIVTHAHLDHSPLARRLAMWTGAQIVGFGPADAGRSDLMQQLAASGELGGGEGVDEEFAPDFLVKDGDVIETSDWVLKVLHTPGHMSNHISLAWGDALFSGDLVMGWASSLVSPPDGDLTAFMASLHRLSQNEWRVFHSGHGAPVTAPNARISELVRHRLSREEAILAGVRKRPTTAEDLAREIYIDTPPALLGAATRNVLAHLIDLTERKLVKSQGDLSRNCPFKSL